MMSNKNHLTKISKEYNSTLFKRLFEAEMKKIQKRPSYRHQTTKIQSLIGDMATPDRDAEFKVSVHSENEVCLEAAVAFSPITFTVKYLHSPRALRKPLYDEGERCCTSRLNPDTQPL